MLERITGSVDSLRPSEVKVARLVLERPAEARDANMARFAAMAGVSEPTVMRFCNALGFDGFQSFRIALAQALALGLPVTHSAIGLDDPVPAVATKTFDHTISSLDRARRALDLDAVTQAVDAVVAASRMLVVGRGASALVAQDVVRQAPLLGLPCAAPADPDQQLMSAAMLEPGTVLLALSSSGRSRTTLEAAAEARRRGATVIGVSGSRSPLLEVADVPIVLATFEGDETLTPTVSRLAGLVLVDVLSTAVAARRGPAHLERLRSAKESSDTLRDGLGPGGGVA